MMHTHGRPRPWIPRSIREAGAPQPRTRKLFGPAGLLIFLAGSAAALCCAAPSFADGRPKNAIGLCGGAPQTLAVTYERSLSSSIALRLHAGSVYFYSSAGGRLQLQKSEGWMRPYLFAGLAAVHSRAENYGDPEGTTGYVWLGPGAAFGDERWLFFAEICALLGGDDDKGFGDDWVFPFDPLAFAVGVMARF